MQNLLNHLLSKISFFTLLFILLLSNCQKDVELEDSLLNPGKELIINGSNDLIIPATTVREIPLEGIRQNVVPLGKVREQRFGEVKASFYTNFRLTVTGFDPESPISLDSAFFYFKYDNTYGSFLQPMDLEVYELNQKLNSNDSLTNAENFDIKPNVIASISNLNIQSNQEGVLKIPVNQAFAQSFVDRFGTSVFANNDGLEDFFKGIYVTVSENSGEDGLVYLNLTDDETKFSIFFNAPNSIDSIYNFEVTNQATWVTQYTQNYTSSEVEPLLNSSNENHETLYISAYSGTKGEVQIPDLSFLGNVIINKAQIAFFQSDLEDPLSNQFPPPNSLFLFLSNPEGTVSLLPGVSTSNLEDFGGLRTLVDQGSNTTFKYEFNITEYIQQLVNGSSISRNLSLSVLNVNSGDRVKIGGGNHPDFPIKLKILYTLAE